MKSNRLSNMELLRIVSMMMVLMVHIDGASLGLPAPDGDVASLSAGDWWRLGVESLTIVGVNCFTMLSGYFSIKLRVRTLTRFLGVALFYPVVITVIYGCLRPDWFSWARLGDACLILSHNDLWYVPAYFCLCLLAPFLNAGCDRLDTRRLGAVWGLFLLYNIWCGWYWGGKFNPTGYTVVQLVLVYLAGRLMARFTPPGGKHRVESAAMWAGVYLLAATAVCASALYLPSAKAFAYNSPFVLIESIALFGLFTSLRFTSRAVNMLASGAFAVYLVHKNPIVWVNLFKPAVVWLWSVLSLPGFTIAAVAITVVTYVAVALIDWLRRAVTGRFF